VDFFRLRQLLCRFFISGTGNSSARLSLEFALARRPGADTLEYGGLPPLFRRQIRTPAKHPQPQLIARKQLHFDSYVNP